MESEESERFLFLRAPLMTPSLRSAYDLVKTRLSESEAEVERKFYHNISSKGGNFIYPMMLRD